MAPIAIIEHQIPGRLRLRVASKRGDVEWFRSVVRRLSGQPAVEDVAANPETGSILIRYSGPADLIEELDGWQDLFTLQRPGPTTAPQPRPGKHDPPTITGRLEMEALLMAGLGALQLTRGQVLGNASDLFWSARNSHLVLDSPPLALGFAGLGLMQLLRGDLLAPSSTFFYRALRVHHMAAHGRELAARPRGAPPAAAGGEAPAAAPGAAPGEAGT